MTAVPGVVVVGPMKAGTTWAHEYLASRGDVCLPAGTKETFFFDRYFARGLAWYRAHFEHFDVTVHQAVVEVAPSYFPSDEIRSRLKATLRPRILAACIREPCARSWSHYVHLRRYGYVHGGLAEAIERHPEIIEASRYSVQLPAWAALVPERRVRLLYMDELRDDRDAFARRLCAALALGYRPVPDRLRRPVNEAAAPASTRVAALARLASHVLRGRRAYALVDLGRTLGLHRLAYGAPGGGRAVPRCGEADRTLLQTRLGREVELVRALAADRVEAWTG